MSITAQVRDWTKARLTDKTIVNESFDIGDQCFRAVVGGGCSAATFSNMGTRPILRRDGMKVEVTWFQDSSENDIRRIVNLSAEANQGTAAASFS